MKFMMIKLKTQGEVLSKEGKPDSQASHKKYQIHKYYKQENKKIKNNAITAKAWDFRPQAPDSNI